MGKRFLLECEIKQIIFFGDGASLILRGKNEIYLTAKETTTLFNEGKVEL